MKLCGVCRLWQLKSTTLCLIAHALAYLAFDFDEEHIWIEDHPY